MLMQAEMLLATRNVTGAKAYIPFFKQTSNFMETRTEHNPTGI